MLVTLLAAKMEHDITVGYVAWYMLVFSDGTGTILHACFLLVFGNNQSETSIMLRENMFRF